MFALSGLNALSAVTIWYATPPSRTAPLLQAVFNNLSTVLSVPFSKWMLGDTKAYAAREPVAAMALVAASVVTALLPTLLSAGSGDGARGQVAWAVFFIVAQVPQVRVQSWLHTLLATVC